MSDQLSSLEIAVGAAFGSEPEWRERSTGTRGGDVRAALEDACLEALARPPARVAFSGGRDSSLVLAAAVTAAKRHGLPAPIPVSLRFPEAPTTHESDWQERVIRHLGLDDWVRIELRDELDCVGPLAAEMLLRDGVRFPANAHLLVPILRTTNGGSLLIGHGGDELLGGWHWLVRGALLARRRPLQRGQLPTVLLGAAPAPVRRWILNRRHGWVPPWLTPAAVRSYAPHARRDRDHPTRYDRYVDWVLRTRHLLLSWRRIVDLAGVEGVFGVAPMLAPEFTDALVSLGGRHGLGGRAVATAAIAGESLPPELIARPSKAIFDAVFAGPATHAFAERFAGHGIDRELIDAAALRTTWLTAPPGIFRSMLALQTAWYAARAGGNVPS